MNRATGIYPAGAAENYDLTSEIVGTGPFRLVEYLPSGHVTMEKFDEYWDQPLPHLDRLTLVITGDEETRVAGLRAQRIDGTQIAPESMQRLEGDERLEILVSEIYSPYTLEPNSGIWPTNDVRDVDQFEAQLRELLFRGHTNVSLAWE